MKPITNRVFKFLSHESNSALRALMTDLELRITIFDPRGKIVQKVKFSPISQNNYMSPKLDSTCQNESKDVLGF